MPRKLSPLFKNLQGKKFGRWFVIELSKKDYHNTYWLCRCDCGNSRVVNKYDLVKGKSISCGCIRKELHSDLPENEAAVRKLYGDYRARSRQKKLEFSITLDEFRNLVSKNCHYCGSEPRIVEYKRDKRHYASKRSPIVGKLNGLDRIDSRKGYITDNTRTCCMTCNYAKHTMSETEFYVWIERVFNNLKTRRDYAR